MNPKQLLSDDDAVSPVIGVILMVAITAILAAVIATFVLGLGDQVSNTAPQASFSFDYDAGTDRNGTSPPSPSTNDGHLTVVHDGGDTIEAGELFVRGASQSSENGDWTSAGNEPFGGASSQIKAGNSIKINVQDSDTVRIVYEDSSGGNSATLGKWAGPNA